jgi:hypothetical protein
MLIIRNVNCFVQLIEIILKFHYSTGGHIYFYTPNQIFQEEGIEIPFAQRDTHLDTGGGPLDIRLVNEKETRDETNNAV